MNPNEIPTIVDNLLNSPDLDKLKPIKMGTIWTEQLKALINIIPGIGGAVAQEIQVIKDYKAAEFFRKFTAYILDLSDTTLEERAKFSKEIEETAQDYPGNVLLGMIDRLDNINKQSILANLTKARINEWISIEDYFRLSSMLERIPYVDLKLLPLYIDNYYDETGDTELLYATGALNLSILDPNDGNKYVLSQLGTKLLYYGMGIDLDVERRKGPEIALETISEEDIKQIIKSDKIQEEIERRSLGASRYR